MKHFAKVAQSYCQPTETDDNFHFVTAKVRFLMLERAKERNV
jgi:hypothetical protein